MKKLRHCIELTLTGPISVESLAKQYLDNCIDYGLKHRSVEHAAGLVAALGTDILSLGSTVGSATALKVADYVQSASSEIIGCLTDTNKISEFVGKQLESQFKGSVRHESHWIYWNL